MENKTKRVFWGFFSLDYKAIEGYLGEMAEKGWMIEKVGRTMAKFRAIEPRKLKFYVDVFKEEGPLTPEKTEESEAYRRLCQESGWTFITSQDYLQFFYTEAEKDPVPIQTDEEIEQKIVAATLWKGELLGTFLFSIIAISALLTYFSIKHTNLTSFVGVAGTILFPILCIIMLVSTGYGLIRVLKARRHVKRGLSIEKPTLKSARRRIMLFQGSTWTITFILVLAFIGDALFEPQTVGMSLLGPLIGTAVGLGLRYIIKKKGTDKQDGILYVTFTFIGIIFLWAIVNPIIRNSPVNNPQRKDSIAAGYPIVELKELVEGSQQGSLVSREFSPGMSPITPRHYNYSESKKIDHKVKRIRVNYYKTIHPYFAEIIFKGVRDQLETGIKWRGTYVLTKTMIVDDAMRDLWQVDHLVLTEDRDEIIVQKGNTVVHLSGDIDFDDGEVREVIINRFFMDNRLED